MQNCVHLTDEVEAIERDRAPDPNPARVTRVRCRLMSVDLDAQEKAILKALEGVRRQRASLRAILDALDPNVVVRPCKD